MNRDERILAYLEGELSAGQRRELEAELLRDEELAARLYEELGTSRLLAAGAGARRRRPRVPRAVAWLAPLAAAALLLLLLLPPGDPGPTGPVLRGQPGALALIAPAPGAATRPLEFRWGSVAGAASYTLELFDAEGRRILTASTVDTLHRADAATPSTGGTGFWWVEARDARAQAIARSEARPIELGPAGGR